MVDINLPIVVGASLIDGINPCAFGVLIFLLAYLAKSSKKSKMLLNGMIYIIAVSTTYFVAGLILLPLIQKLGAFSVISYIVIAGIAIIAGLLEIKDFFVYGKWLSLSIFPSEAERIKKYIKGVSDRPATAFFLGVFVALVELPCTGAVYLAVLALMSISGVTISNVLLLIIYNIIFVLPLVVILLLVYRKMSAEKFEKWRQKHKGLMRLLIGLVLIALGVWMLYTIL